MWFGRQVQLFWRNITICVLNYEILIPESVDVIATAMTT
jgi:hypothetical protein